jgi:Fe-S-cluster containining protein
LKFEHSWQIEFDWRLLSNSGDPMTNAPATGSAKVNVKAALGTCQLNLSVTVPAGPTRIDDLLPLLQIMSNQVVSSAEEEAQRRGQPISCRKGCGACCRQLVPISPVEARHVARLVAEMPEPRQSQIRERFAAAREKLEAAGIWQRLENRQAWEAEGVLDTGLDYFRQRIPCPFLEDESCSIHLERPLTCREYLVTSPAENCSNPTPEGIEWLPLPAKVWVAAARCEPGAAGNRYVNWVPLIQALDWVQSHDEPMPDKTGPELLRSVFDGLAGTGNQGETGELNLPFSSPPAPELQKP